MPTVNIHHAKTHLSRLIEQVTQGAEFIIAKAGRPVARLVPLADTPRPKHFGLLKGTIRIASDFDDPMPDDVLASFEGRHR